MDDVGQEVVIRDRRHLSEDGIVLPIIAINRQTGRIENRPELVSRGFARAEDGSAFMQTCKQPLLTVAALPPECDLDNGPNAMPAPLPPRGPRARQLRAPGSTRCTRQF